MGKLYNKYHNWKSKQAIVKNKIPAVTEIRYEEKENEQDHIRALKYDSLTFEETLYHWKSSSATRLNSLKQNLASGKMQQIGEIWHFYKESYGYKLVGTFSFVYTLYKESLDFS